MMLREAMAALSVEQGADAADIRRAFRAAAVRAHPDQGGDEEAFILVRRAYEFLMSQPLPLTVAPQIPVFTLNPARNVSFFGGMNEMRFITDEVTSFFGGVNEMHVIIDEVASFFGGANEMRVVIDAVRDDKTDRADSRGFT